MASQTQHSQKTVAVLFGTSQKPPKRQIIIDKQKIEWKNKAKYLGVTLDKALYLNEHSNITRQKAKRARAALYPVLNRRSQFTMPTRISIYKIYIRPILMYAIIAWGPLLSKANWRKLEAVQNITIRTINGAHYLTKNKVVLTSTNVNPLKIEVERAANIFYYKNSQSTFEHPKYRKDTSKSKNPPTQDRVIGNRLTLETSAYGSQTKQSKASICITYK